MPRKRSARYIALAEVNMDFTQRELDVFDTFMENGRTLQEVARHLRRAELEIFLLYLDRLLIGKLEPRYSLHSLRRKDEAHEQVKSTAAEGEGGTISC